MIYCVIPPELEADLFERLVDHYKDNPNVTVMVDRRDGPDRRQRRSAGEFEDKRQLRDRRRARPTGSFPPTDVPNGEPTEH